MSEYLPIRRGGKVGAVGTAEINQGARIRHPTVIIIEESDDDIRVTVKIEVSAKGNIVTVFCVCITVHASNPGRCASQACPASEK